MISGSVAPAKPIDYIKQHAELLGSFKLRSRFSSEAHGIWFHASELLNYLALRQDYDSQLRQQLHDMIIVGTALVVLANEFDKYKDCVTNEEYGNKVDYKISVANLYAISGMEIDETGIYEGRREGYIHVGMKNVILTVGYHALIKHDPQLPNIFKFFDTNGSLANVFYNCLPFERLISYQEGRQIDLDKEFLRKFANESILLCLEHEKDIKKIKKNENKEARSFINQFEKFKLIQGATKLDFVLSRIYQFMGLGMRAWLLQGPQLYTKQDVTGKSVNPQPGWYKDVYWIITANLLGVKPEDAKKLYTAVSSRLKDRVDSKLMFFQEGKKQKNQERYEARKNLLK